MQQQHKRPKTFACAIYFALYIFSNRLNEQLEHVAHLIYTVQVRIQRQN
jgi:hypothetical protein